MSRSFRTALLSAIDGPPKIALKRVAEGAEVSYDQLLKVKQRETASTNVEDARRVANWFGVTLDEFLQDDTALLRSEVVAQYNALTPQERDFLRIAAKERLGADLKAG